MAGSWQGLVNQPTFNTSTMLLLSDGRVMVQEDGTPHWYALTPAADGSYVKGTWSPLADMAIWRRYYASGMLKDGRIILIGGEDSGAGGDTNLGQIYEPASDTWGALPSPPGWPASGRRGLLRATQRALHDRRAALWRLHHLRSHDQHMVCRRGPAGSDQ
jgi:hypothetical protein